MVGAQAEAMKSAAANPNGAMMGFMGMGMAQAAGGMNAAQLFQMGQQQQPIQQAAPAANGWKCACGATATGKFCPECGAKKSVIKEAICPDVALSMVVMVRCFLIRSFVSFS